MRVGGETPGQWPRFGPSRLGFLPQHRSQLQNCHQNQFPSETVIFQKRYLLDHIHLEYAEKALEIILETPSPLATLETEIFYHKFCNCFLLCRHLRLEILNDKNLNLLYIYI